MNDPIEEQRKLIDKLYQMVEASSPEDATSSCCKFTYRHGFKDGSTSVKQTFSYTLNSEKVPGRLNSEFIFEVQPVVEELHAKMKAHTGGDWDAFTLTIGEDGRVTTKFEYPNS